MLSCESVFKSNILSTFHHIHLATTGKIECILQPLASVGSHTSKKAISGLKTAHF